MKFAKSLRVKLTILYLLTNVIPIVITALVMPGYYQSLITQETETLTAATLTSLTRNIDTYLDDLDRLTLIPYFNDGVMEALKSRADPAAPSPSEQLIVTQALYTTFPTFLQNARTNILSTVVLSLNGPVFVATKDDASASAVPNYPFSQQSWYQKAKDANGKVTYINPHPQNYLLQPLAPQVFSVARLIKDPDTLRPLAIILADAGTDILQKIMNGIKLNVSSIIAIFGTDHQLLYSSSPLSPQVSQEIAQKANPIHDTEDSYIAVSKPTGVAQWEVVILLSRSEITEKWRWLYIVGILFAISGFCLTFLVFFILSRWIINPFQQMMGVMKKVQEGDLQIRIATEGEDEIAILGNAFNTMVSQLNDLIEREYKATLSLRNAEYRALQSQIQPHFLYNILNSFMGLNRFGERQALEKAILALSALLRYILSKDEWVTLKDEFLFLQKYCALQKVRFQDKMTFVIQYDDAVANFKMPKVLLQPLVENAIVHGMEPAASPCELHVLATLKQEQEAPAVYISIQDNGVGLGTQTQPDHTGLGLSNVRERLKMAYENASLSITNLMGGGTQVVIAIPITEEKENDENSHCR
jgi:two-component system sensor histidine kinase YesM